MKIFTITTLNHNPGDDFIREGIYHLWRDFIKDPQITNIHKHDAPQIFRENPKILESIDLILQAGTPCYWYLRENQNSSTSEWSFIWKEHLFGKNHPPVMNIGAGSYFAYHDDGTANFKGKWRDYILQMTRRSILTTVRDPVADHLLKWAGLEGHSLIACPALWVGDAFKVQTKKDPNLITATYLPFAGHYAMTNDLDVEGYRRAFGEIIERLSKKYEVILVAHSKKDHEKSVETYPGFTQVCVETPNELADFYSKSSLHIGSRVHGAYAVASNGGRFILLNSDTRAFMADPMGMPRYYMNDVPDAVERIVKQAEMLMNPAEEEKILTVKAGEEARYHRLFEDFFDNHS